MTDTQNPAARRRLRPFHVVIIVLLVGVLGYIAYAWSHLAASAAGEGPPTQQSVDRTTPEEAQARSQGQGRDGSNSSGDAYTAQNQSRPPSGQP